MKVKKRLKYYAIGFGLGLVFTFIIFQGRGWDWLPGNRVLTSIKSSDIYYSEAMKCEMNCKTVSKKDIFELLENGDVNFSESETHETPKVYVIENEGLKVSFELNNRDSVAVLNQIFSGNDCNCDDKSKEWVALYKPNEMLLEELRQNKLKIEKPAQCYQKFLDIKPSIIDSMLVSGTIDLNQSYPNQRPNPLFFITYKSFLFEVEKGATKTRVNRIIDLNDFTSEDQKKGFEFIFNLSASQNYCNCNK